MTSVHPRLVRLLQRTQERTHTGQLFWRETGEASFVLELPSGAISVASRDKDGLPPYSVEVFNSDGVAIENVDGGTLEADSPDDSLVKGLYESARRSAEGVSATIDALTMEVERAGLEVVGATYGADQQPVDVTQIVRGLVRDGRLAFTADN